MKIRRLWRLCCAASPIRQPDKLWFNLAPPISEERRPILLGSATAARRPVFGRTGADLIHDAADCTRAAATFGAASEAPIDLASASHRALGRNRSYLLIRNHVARTNDHRTASGSDGPSVTLQHRRSVHRSSDPCCVPEMAVPDEMYSCHASAAYRNGYDMKSF